MPPVLRPVYAKLGRGNELASVSQPVLKSLNRVGWGFFMPRLVW